MLRFVFVYDARFADAPYRLPLLGWMESLIIKNIFDLSKIKSEKESEEEKLNQNRNSIYHKIWRKGHSE